jgi:hypothetical protein
VKLFSADGDFAFVSVGQFARGVFVIGQFAVGVFVIGQFAVGVVSVGQFVLAPGWGVAMLGLGGRGKLGLIRLLPWWQTVMPPNVRVPSVVDETALLTPDGPVREGYLEATVDRDGTLVTSLGTPVPLRLGAVLPAEACEGPERERPRVFVWAARNETFEEAAFREAPARQVALEGSQVMLVRRPKRYVPSAFSDAPIRPVEVVVRLVAWVLLVVAVALIVFVAAVGLPEFTD